MKYKRSKFLKMCYTSRALIMTRRREENLLKHVKGCQFFFFFCLHWRHLPQSEEEEKEQSSVKQQEGLCQFSAVAAHMFT